MKKTFNICILLVSIMFILLLFSCASVSNYKPGTSNPVKSDYIVLDQIEEEFSSNILFGIFSWGDNNLKLLDSIKKKYNADEIINVTVVEVENLIFGFFYQKKYLVTGTAIRYNN